VVITGTNLGSATRRQVSATASAAITGHLGHLRHPTSPAGSAGAVDVTVTTAAGTSAPSPADAFTYVRRPTVTSIARQRPDGGGTSVVITAPTSGRPPPVKFGTASAAITANTATSVTATSQPAAPVPSMSP